MSQVGVQRVEMIPWQEVIDGEGTGGKMVELDKEERKEVKYRHRGRDSVEFIWWWGYENGGFGVEELWRRWMRGKGIGDSDGQSGIKGVLGWVGGGVVATG